METKYRLRQNLIHETETDIPFRNQENSPRMALCIKEKMNNSTAQSANKPGDTERGVVMRGQKQTTKLDIMQHRNTALEALI